MGALINQMLDVQKIWDSGCVLDTIPAHPLFLGDTDLADVESLRRYMEKVCGFDPWSDCVVVGFGSLLKRLKLLKLVGGFHWNR